MALPLVIHLGLDMMRPVTMWAPITIRHLVLMPELGVDPLWHLVIMLKLLPVVPLQWVTGRRQEVNGPLQSVIMHKLRAKGPELLV